jgi:hypothetical protein
VVAKTARIKATAVHNRAHIADIAQSFPLSSPGLTARSSIPETVVLEP